MLHPLLQVPVGMLGTQHKPTPPCAPCSAPGKHWEHPLPPHTHTLCQGWERCQLTPGCHRDTDVFMAAVGPAQGFSTLGARLNSGAGSVYTLRSLYFISAPFPLLSPQQLWGKKSFSFTLCWKQQGPCKLPAPLVHTQQYLQPSSSGSSIPAAGSCITLVRKRNTSSSALSSQPHCPWVSCPTCEPSLLPPHQDLGREQG